ncbi:MAG: hypothetical protein ACREQN_06170 [Candidatus Binataceae bacterium]
MALLLAFAILAAGIPVVSGIAFQPSGPAITLDLCHPMQAVDAVSSQCSIPVLSLFIVTLTLSALGVVAEPVRMVTVRPGEAPDPPPPEA